MKVLVVCPRFAPANAADCHRARLLIPYLQENGCSAEVLAVEAADTGCPIDPWLSSGLPSQVPIHRVHAGRTHVWGFNGLAQRTLLRIMRMGDRILQSGKFDLIWFSTTEFLLHLAGPYWKYRWRVPFCIDLQDPWVTDYYQRHPQVRPPGGRLKFGVMRRLQALAERTVMQWASGVLAVSSAYIDDIQARYPELKQCPALTLPFPAEPAEFDRLPAAGNGAGAVPRSVLTLRYVGVVGPYMLTAVNAFFEAWRAAIDEGLIHRDDLVLQAFGTSYAPAGIEQRKLLPVAERYGLCESVVEQTSRLSYREALQVLASADGLLVFGSDEPAYTPSKINSCLLAGRPTVVIVHEASPVVAFIKEVGGAEVVLFSAQGVTPTAIIRLRDLIVGIVKGHAFPPLATEAMHAHTARAHARLLVTWFRSVMLAGSTP
jgi:hypothetical protein